ncbi:MFS transporter [Streptomyces sp. NPDC051561]|uniref:MFS transporter n=1 Tax=Streptomyces sp. NPDC051561 TaxID=3365658 RepID=UPI00378BCD45
MPAPPPHAVPADAAEAARAQRVVRVTVALLFSAWLIDYAERLVINLVLPSVGAEFDLDRGQQGLVVSAFFLAYALCQIPGGMLADRFGARKVATWALLAWSLFTVLTGFAWSFAALLALRFLFGAAEAIFPAASMKVLVERTTPKERMSAQGLIMSSNAIAGVLTPLAVAPLIAVFGWRSAFFSTAALGVFVVLALRLWLPDPLTRTRSDGSDGSDGSDRSDAAGAGVRVRVRDVLRIGVLWRFALIMFGYNVIVWGLTTWVPSYLSEERGLPLTTASALLAVPALASARATVISGRLSDRLEGNHRKVIVPAMAVTGIALPLMAFSSSLVGFAVFGTLAACNFPHCPGPRRPLRSSPPSCS